MTIRRFLPIGALFICGVIAAVSPLRSADDPKPADNKPADPDQPPPTFMRIYDVRVLADVVADFPLSSSPHAPAFVIPANHQFEQSEYTTGGGGVRTSLFPDRRERAGPTYQERIEQISKLITDTVEPEDWRDSGGLIGSIRELNGSLIITQTAAAHKEIAELLAQLADVRNHTIRTTADWLVLPPGDVEKLLKPGMPHRAAAAREVDPAALEKLPQSARHYHADIRGLNSQTVHFVSGRERTVTVNVTTVAGTGVAGYTPVVGNAGEGVALEVTPAVDLDERRVLLTIQSTFNGPAGPDKPMTVRVGAVEGPGTRPAEPSATYQELNSVVQEFRTVARIPLGTPVIVGTMTLEPSAKNAEGMQLVLIIKVQSAE
jgi:hypothetical protein